MRVCIFEDQPEAFAPLSLTRPSFDLLCGITSLRDKIVSYFQTSDWAVWVRPGLAEFYRSQHPNLRINDAAWLSAEPVVLVSGQWIPPAAGRVEPAGSAAALCDGRPVFACNAIVESGSDMPLSVALGEAAESVECVEVGGFWVERPWNLVDRNGAQIRRDFPGWLQEHGPSSGSSRLALVGPRAKLWVARSARIDPFVVADTSSGPVIIDEEAVITAFTRLEGPCYVGARTQIMGAKIRAGTTLGVECRVGGEVEASIIHGYSNKYHEGFLGHSYIGEWVNLGAGTHNSDLRNDYGEVSVTIGGQAAPTGLTKVGCFMGDHTKTGLGTLINTGTLAGAFCNLLPAGRFAPKEVPSFMSWWNGWLREAFSLEQVLLTARQVMKRRGQELTSAHEHFYRRLWDETDAERQLVLREQEVRRYRRTG